MNIDIPVQPEGNICLASVDPKYFDKYHPYILDSFKYWDEKLHLHMVNPTVDMIYEVSEYDNVTYSTETVDFEFDGLWEPYMAQCRFMMAHMLYKVDKLFIIDFDCILNKSIEWPEFDLGLIKAPHTQAEDDFDLASMNYIGHTTFWSKKSFGLLKQVSDEIYKLGTRHNGADMLALSTVCTGKEYSDLYKTYTGVASLLPEKEKATFWQRGFSAVREKDEIVIRERHDYYRNNEMG